jgi:hypothetical protein
VITRFIATAPYPQPPARFIAAVVAAVLLGMGLARPASSSGAAQAQPGTGASVNAGAVITATSAYSLYLPAMDSGVPAFGYGIQAHMVTRSQAERSLVTTRYLDFDWAKQQIEWPLYTVGGTSGIAFGVMDQLVLLGMQKEVNLLFSVVGSQYRAAEDSAANAPDELLVDLPGYTRFVRKLAERYCGTSLKAIEVWNEQNLQEQWGKTQPDPAEYFALLAPAYEAIKDECPSMMVISGGLAQTGDNLPLAIDNFTYFEGMLDAGLLDSVDGIGVHALGYNVPPGVTWENACAAIQLSGNSFNGPCDTPHHSWSFRSTLEGYQAMLDAREASAVPLWVTEFGWAAGGALEPGYEYAGDNDHLEQADWTVEAFRVMRASGRVEAAFLWNLNFPIVAAGTQKAQWGIVEAPDWSPLPVFTAISKLNYSGRARPTLADLAALDAAEAVTPAAPIHVPEPATVVLLAAGLAGVAGYVKRRRGG